MPLWLANGAFHEGWVRWHAGDRDRGTAQMHEGLRLLREQGQSLYLPLFGVLLAETEAEKGCYDAALATVDAELVRISQTGQCWFLAETHRVHGEIILKSHAADVEAAEGDFARAIEVARTQSAKQFELRAAIKSRTFVGGPVQEHRAPRTARNSRRGFADSSGRTSANRRLEW